MATSPIPSDTLYHQLRRLQSENQDLLQEEARLRAQFSIVHERLSTNNRDIFVNMNDLLSQYLYEQRAQSQEKFWTEFNKSDVVFRGLSKLMDSDPHLKSAVQAVADGVSTDGQQKDVLLALLTELSGQPVAVLPIIARRVIEHNEGSTPSFQQSNTVETPVEIGDGDDVRHPSILSLADTDVKSEIVSPLLAEGSPTNVIDPALTNDAQSTGIEPLERNFPGLLQQLRESETAKPLPRAVQSSTLVSSKRKPTVFGPVINNPSPATAKKLKTGKEIVIPTAFALLMKKLEVVHAKNALSILDHIKCSKCDQVKRDSRVLNCLHVYCHRCTQKLRIEAEKGDAVHGFRAFCVQEGCTEVVSGKTAVVDPEVMEFLVWYDKQTPGLTTSAAQTHVLKSAQAKRPGDVIVKNYLLDIKKQSKARELAGENDEVCNVLEVAKMAKKLG